MIIHTASCVQSDGFQLGKIAIIISIAFCFACVAAFSAKAFSSACDSSSIRSTIPAKMAFWLSSEAIEAITWFCCCDALSSAVRRATSSFSFSSVLLLGDCWNRAGISPRSSAKNLFNHRSCKRQPADAFNHLRKKRRFTWPSFTARRSFSNSIPRWTETPASLFGFLNGSRSISFRKSAAVKTYIIISSKKAGLLQPHLV